MSCVTLDLPQRGMSTVVVSSLERERILMSSFISTEFKTPRNRAYPPLTKILRSIRLFLIGQKQSDLGPDQLFDL